jgi:hypothetical protein
MIWNQLRVLDSQRFHLSSGRDASCGISQIAELSAGDDASATSRLAGALQNTSSSIVTGTLVVGVGEFFLGMQIAYATMTKM